MAGVQDSPFTIATFFILFWNLSFVASLPENCTYSLNAYKVTIVSPNYPSPYPSGRKCSWDIQTLQLHKIKATFEHFDLEESAVCEYDNVTAADYKNNQEFVRAVFCGHQMPYPLVSSENRMKLAFLSDPMIQGTGFKINISAVLCGGNLEENSGTIQSPIYPDGYTGDKECIWTIRVEKGFQILIQINISMYDSNDSGDCHNEYLQIVNGLYPNGDMVFHQCGPNPIKDIQSSSNEVLLRFISSTSVQRMNFTATFHKKSCGHTFEQDEGIILSPKFETMEGTEECVWKITVPEGYHVFLSFRNLQIPKTDNCTSTSLTIYDGSATNNIVLLRHCGYNVPHDLHSSANSVLIQYVYSALPINAAFAIEFSKASCGGVFKDEGQIELPAVEFISTPLDCRWVLIVAQGKHVVLHVNKVKVFESCSDGQLMMYEGTYSKKRAYRSYCSVDDPKEVQSLSNVLSLHLHAKQIISQPEFQISFTTIRTCGGKLIGSGEFESPSFESGLEESVFCRWQLTVDEDKHVSLSIRYLELLSPNDCFEIYDGFDTTTSPQHRICGNYTISEFGPIDTLNNTMTVILKISPVDDTKSEIIDTVKLAANFSAGSYEEYHFGSIREVSTRNPGNLTYYADFYTRTIGVTILSRHSGIRLKISTLRLWECKNCNCDYLTVEPDLRHSSVHHSKSEKFCTSIQVPKIIAVDTSRVRIVFHTNDNVAARSMVILFQHIAEFPKAVY